MMALARTTASTEADWWHPGPAGGGKGRINEIDNASPTIGTGRIDQMLDYCNRLGSSSANGNCLSSVS